MRRKVFFRLLGGGLFIVLIILTVSQWREIERSVIQDLINRAARPFFADSIRIEKTAIDRGFRIRLWGIKGAFQARQGPVPLEIKVLESKDPLFLLLRSRPVRFIFEGVRPQGSPREGLLGEFSIMGGKDWRFKTLVDFKNTDLEDLRWLDPQNLGGASGAMRGTLSCVQVAGHDPVFNLNVAVAQPGGLVQAKFFDLFLPYLPTSAQKDRVMKLVSGKQQLVRYQTAELEMGLPQPDRVKILLHILVLDYNLKLNLDVTVRMDQKDSLMQIARLMGLIEAKVS